MKISSFFLVLQWLLPLVSAYGARGVAERAMYFLVYMMEEIHQNQGVADGWKIAPGCVGTRKGIFASKRCNLAEFLDYIWAPYDASDTRPDKNRIWWGPTMPHVKDGPGITGLISGIKKEKGSKEGIVNTDDKTKPICWGYEGKLDVETKLWPGSGLTTYQDSLAAFGQRAAQLNAEMDGYIARGELGDPAKPPVQGPEESDKEFKTRKKRWDGNVRNINEFRDLFKQAKDAAQVVVNMRLKDSWGHVKRDVNWKSKLGVDPVWRTLHGDVGEPPRVAKVGSWDELDKESTVNKMVSELGISVDEARVKFDTVWGEIASGENYKAHQAAIEAAAKARSDFDKPPPASCG